MLPTIETYYYYWNVPPHLNQATGLSHYAALGHDPASEVVTELEEDTARINEILGYGEIATQ